MSDRHTQVLQLIRLNPVVCEILERAPVLGLDDAWLAGGCLFQTCWNVLSGHRPTRGIKDYDLFYFDGRDLSVSAEDRVNRCARELFGDLRCTVDARNQARVHVWCKREWGVSDYPPIKRTKDGVNAFIAVCSMIAVRRGERGTLELHAPLGVDDIVHRIMRPNPKLRAAPLDAYARKAERWSNLWPEAVVAPFGAWH